MNTLGTSKPTLLFYCQHSVGMGHLTRSMALAQALAQTFHVEFLNGGPMPKDFPAPEGVTVIDLPPLGMTDGHNLMSRDANTDVHTAQARRVNIIQEAFRKLKPDVILIELFPFGRKKFAFELLPLLKQARRASAPPLVLCSVRDILVHDRPDQLRHDDRAAWLCNRYFDGVLVHADPQLAEFSESFQPRKALRIPLCYTGFVARDASTGDDVTRGSHILVSAGGGMAGGTLFRSAVEAHTRFGAQQGRRMRLVAGPFFPEPEWVDLQRLSSQCPSLELIRSVPNLADEMRRAAISLSQCGYNTAMDILSTNVPALVVPYAAGRENEQTNRAHRLERLGSMRVLNESALAPQRLHAEILNTLHFTPRENALMLNGGEYSARLVQRLLKMLRPPPVTEEPLETHHVA